MIKDVLKEARNEIGLNQYEVAKKVNVTKQTYLKWESGSTEPKASQIALLSKILKISADEICTGKINKRYNLENFITEMAKINPKREIEVLENWLLINDHEVYFRDLKSKTTESQK